MRNRSFVTKLPERNKRKLFSWNATNFHRACVLVLIFLPINSDCSLGDMLHEDSGQGNGSNVSELSIHSNAMAVQRSSLQDPEEVTAMVLNGSENDHESEKKCVILHYCS